MYVATLSLRSETPCLACYRQPLTVMMLLDFEDGGGWGGNGGGGYGGGGYGGGGGGGPPPRDGDWTCPSCGANVFASKMEVCLQLAP